MEKVSRLFVKHGKLLDSNGNSFQLRGLSLGWHNWWPRFYNEGVIEELSKKWNCNVVRAAIGVDHQHGYLRKSEQSMALLETVIGAAIKNNIYVIADWHAHKLHEKNAVEFFKRIAEKYGAYPNIIYEIFNEPVNQSWRTVKDYSIKVIEAIRKIDYNNMIIVGSPHWDQDVDVVMKDRLPNEYNIMYSFHFYAATHREAYRKKMLAALDEYLPIFISECGGMNADGDGEIDTKSWNEWMKIVGEKHLSWIGWSVADKNETCSILYPTASSYGNWNDKDIKPWGKILKTNLKNHIQS